MPKNIYSLIVIPRKNNLLFLSTGILLTLLIFIGSIYKKDVSGSGLENLSFTSPFLAASPLIPSPVPYSVVFVSRQIPENGSIYWDEANDMPGVGPHSRFRVCSPGKLLMYKANGALITLIDGSNPTAASLYLIDVNAPDVNYAGNKIVFAGLPAAPVGEEYNTAPNSNPNAWRLYTINKDGSGLTQLTFSDMSLNYTQFGDAASGLMGYDDTDPCYLPDGRIVFSSTRYPSFAQYSGVRTTNLFVVNADGSNLHRITSERNGADRPVVDPQTGRIVYSRWWRNHRFPYDEMTTVADGDGFLFKSGLSSDRNIMVGGADMMWRNAWHAATINPDGTDIKMFAGGLQSDVANHIYGCAFTPSGDLITNFFPMFNMTEAAGFGGLRKYERGPGVYEHLFGITDISVDNYAHETDPTSYGIYNSEYAGEPDVLPDGRIMFSWCADYNQQYGLYVMNADGSGKTLIYDNPLTTELRIKAVKARTIPPIIVDSVLTFPSLLPPTIAGPFNGDGVFTFECFNVYYNDQIDVDIASAPAIGSAKTIRFFIDHQRTSPGSFPTLDWPILLNEKTIKPDGFVSEPNAPANVPLFEQLRSSNPLGYDVPRAGEPFDNGVAHVAGMNFSREGAKATCVGCHSGHSMIPVPATREDSEFTNLAPGATVEVSSSRDVTLNKHVIDRRVQKGEDWQVWNSAIGTSDNQWVLLKFPVPITIRTIVLYNVPSGGEGNSTIALNKTTVTLYSDANGLVPIISKNINNVPVNGKHATFADVIAQSVRVKLKDISGTFYGNEIGAIAEIEVVASGDISGAKLEAPSNGFSAQIFPNPVNDLLHYTLNYKPDANINVRVIDINGVVVKNFETTMDAAITEDEIFVADLAAGIYFIIFNSGIKRETFKFVKL